MELERKVDELVKRMDRLCMLLESDGKLKHEGLAEKVHRHDDEIKDLLTSRKIAYAKLTWAAAAGAAAINIIFFVLKLIFH